MNLDLRQSDRRINDYPVWTDRRQSPRRVAPQIYQITLDGAQEIAKLRVANKALATALQGLFEHCVMVHKHWGEGSNQREADAAQAAARAALAKAMT